MELLERFAAGDLEAFEALFREHQKEVYRWAVRIVRDTGIAEDLTVETFWRIYRARQRFDPVAGNFRAWARRIATNAALDHLRHARDRKSTRLNSSHSQISYAVFCLNKKNCASMRAPCMKVSLTSVCATSPRFC